MRPIACQPKKRLTRSKITADRCWISSAAGPSTRSTSVAGSGLSSPIARGQVIFIGSLWAAISGPAISAQRAMISFDAKPCALRLSLKAAPVNSDKGRGKLREGLFIGSALLCHAGAMNLAVRMPRRKKASVPEAAVLLAWYDRHRRVLPWRARRGEQPDPYRVWLSEIMLQQTNVKTVAPYYAKFLARWPTVEALGGASLDGVLRAWAGLGYYARARNLHVCAKAVAEIHRGKFPASLEDLRALPG